MMKEGEKKKKLKEKKKKKKEKKEKKQKRKKRKEKTENESETKKEPSKMWSPSIMIMLNPSSDFPFKKQQKTQTVPHSPRHQQQEPHPACREERGRWPARRCWPPR